MSRATFYEHFGDFDDCFLAAVRRTVAPVRADLEAVIGSADPRPPWAIVAAALGATERDPDAARLILLEAFGGSATVRAEQEELLDLIEQSIDHYGALATEARVEIPARALLGGVGNQVVSCLVRREGRPSELVGDLRRWVACYRCGPAERRLGGEGWERLGKAWVEASAEPIAPRPSTTGALPRGRSALSAEEVASAHRERLIVAMARCAAEKGYLAMTVTDVVELAGVTRAAFYAQFRNKEDAFLATLSHGIQRAAEAVAGSFFTDGDWPDRVWDSLDSFASYIAANPDLAFAGTVEAFSAGPAAVRRTIDGRMAFTLFLEEGYRYRPEAEALPRICSGAISGAIEELLRRQIVRGRTTESRELVPAMAFVALAPYVGAEQALDLVSERCREPA